jgi:membrane-bound ClpP family serine protease
MATVKTPTRQPKPAHKREAGTLFTKENHKWMIIGGALIVLGFIAMSGGKAIDPTQFKPEAVYSTMRITIAPILVLLGLCVLVYAILKKGKSAS